MPDSQMNKPVIDQKFGRQAFGGDPAGYHAARPPYPDWVFETLIAHDCFATGNATFEIGPGTGIATHKLLHIGADPLIGIEPDIRLATFLQNSIGRTELNVITETFEDSVLEDHSFDLGFCATAFHWLNEDTALAKVASLLKPGGWWAMVSNNFGDHLTPNTFHEATKLLLGGPSSPSEGATGIPFALDTEARFAALNRTGAFDLMEHRMDRWSFVLDPEQVVALYSTFSNITIRPDKEAVLSELGRIASDEFGGRVTRNIVTTLYLARRRAL